MKDVLKDTDIFENPEHPTPDQWEDRQTVKVIIKNDKGEVALVTNPVHNLFLLPGGGAESNDLEKEAVREALEETNYHVEIVEKVAELEEFRNRDAKHYFTTCFLAKEIGRTEEDLRTDEEKENGLEVEWFSLEDALEVMSRQKEMVKKGEVGFYNTAFNIVRDSRFLEM